MLPSQKNQYSNANDPTSYFEYQFNIPTGNTVPSQTTAYLDPNGTPAGTMTYYGTTGASFNRFSTFMLKAILLSNNPVIIPNMRDIRAIALMK